MAKKKETENKTQASAAKTPGLSLPQRQELLARVAGSVAAAIVQAPSASTSSAAQIAEVAVDIAKHILRQAGVEDLGKVTA